MAIKKTFKSLTLQDWIFTVFSFLWVSIVLLDYLNKQIIYIPSITYFKYINLFIFLGLLGSFISASYCRIGLFKKFPSFPVNGLSIFALFVIAVCTVTLSYNKYWQASLDYTNYLHLIGKASYTLGCTLMMLTGVFSIGNLIRAKLIKTTMPKFTGVMVDISLGFVAYTLALMILGLAGVLSKYTVIGVIILFGALNYKQTWSFIKMTLWQRIKRPQSLSFWGGFVAFFILIYVTLNYFYTQAPFPLGFDARNYYVNISRLIADSGNLIEGFQPYAWGLVMSTGYLAFNSPEITLFISALGGILSLFAIYHFSNYYLKVSANSSFVIVLLFLLTPTVTNQFIIEFKVDLALVFFQMVIISFFLWWLFESKTGPVEIKKLLGSKSDYRALALLGILLGYCLSIKVLSVFLIFGLFLGMWWYHEDMIGILALSALSIGIILVVGLDELSGLRDYHLSPEITGAALIILGLVGLAYSFIKFRQNSIDSFKAIAFCGIFCFISFSPWIIKNYSYTKSLSITKLLMGDKPRPELNLKKFEREYRSNNKENN